MQNIRGNKLTSAVYDYLTASVIVGLLFVVAVVAIPNTSFVGLLSVDQQQLRSVAIEVLNDMLLSVGHPVDWGSYNDFNPQAVGKFGLALSESSSSFVLDPDKVERLVLDNPLGCLDYLRVHRLMGLQGYGFNVKIAAPFDVVTDNLSVGNNLKFRVTVKFNNGKPIPNAVIDAKIVYALYEGGSSDDENYSLRLIHVSNRTDELGKGVVEYGIGENSDFVAVFQTTVADVTTVTAIYGNFPPNNIAEVNMVKDEVVLTHPKSRPNDNRWIENVVAFTEDGLVTLFNGTKADALNYGSRRVWKRIFNGLKNLDPILLIFNVNCVERGVGRKDTLVVGPYPNVNGSRVIEYGGTPMGTTVELHRAVKISGMTYVVQLLLWKE